MEKRENKMAVMSMGKLVFTMSLPLMISLLVQSLYNIVDGIFVARLSENAFTATTLAYPVQILMVAVSVGTGVGVNALISQKIGAKRYDEANQVATAGLVLAFICAAIFMVLGILCAGGFARLFADDPQTAVLCEQYLRICMIFCLGIFVETVVQRFLQATGNTFLSMVSLVVGAVTNLILDPIMIFGLLGCPAMGIEGAAIATVIGQWMGAVVALALNHYKNPEIHFVFRGFRMRRSIVGAIYKVGFPTIVMQAMGSIMLSAMNVILMPFSSTAVAFYGVYYRLQSFLFMPMNGLGQAAIPIVGYNYGASNGKRIMEALKTTLPAAICIALLGTVVFMIFPGQLLNLFAASATMLEIGISALRIISVTFVPAAVTIVIGYSVAGLGNGVINMISATLRQLVIFVPVTYLFARFFDISLVWYASWVAEGIAVVYSVWSLKRELRRKVYPLCGQTAE